MKKFIALIALAILMVGCGSNNSATPTAGPTVTVTETATATPSPVQVTKAVTPPACLTAIKAAEQIQMINYQFIQTVTPYPVMVKDAFHAGLVGSTGEANSVLARMQSATSQMHRENQLLGGAVTRFNTAKAECRNN